MKYQITLFFFCLFTYLSQAQVNYYYDQSSEEYKCTSDLSLNPQMILNMIDTIKYNKDLLACCYYRLGFYYDNIENDYVEAIRLHEIAASLRETEKDKDGLLWKSYANLAINHNKIEYYVKALDYVDKAFKADEQFEENPKAHTVICRAYREIGEISKSMDAGRKAVELAANGQSEGNAKLELGVTLIVQKTPESLKEAVKTFDEAINFYQQKNKKKYVARGYNNRGNALDELYQYEEAIESYRIAQKICEDEEDTLYLAVTLNNIAFIYHKQKKYREAIKVLEKALQLKQQHHDNAIYQFDYASTYENLGDNYEALGNIDKALKYYQFVLINLTDNFRNKNINANPTIKGNHYIYNKPDLLRLLDLKAQAALKSGNIDLAYDTYKELDNWINEFYKDLSTKASKLTWIARAHTMYGNAIEVALKKGEQEKAFEYAERAHAVLLWQSLSQQAARSLLLEDERREMDDLTAKIRQADQQYRNQQISINAVRALEMDREKLEQEFDDEHPQYKKRKYQTESTTVAQVQNMIDENTAFIEYYWTDKQLHIFAITQKELTVHTIAPENLAADITELRKILTTSKCEDCTNRYTSLAHGVYKKLIPQHIHNNPNLKRLVIVADKQIGTLPFSALATEMTAENFNHNYPFLLKKYSTNYLYSAGSFLQLQQKSIEETSGFAGFAPMEYHIPNRYFSTLHKAKEEVEKIEDTYWVWQKATYKKEKATKQAFTEALRKKYQILLLATHAEYRNGKGGIAFYNEMMNQAEIDQLDNIQIHRLILSACQTAEGEQNSGEGILSLGWNFAYKGVPSITMTQWSVDESKTMEIMIGYHEKLKAKIPADQALQNAQKQYLKNVLSAKHYHPYYWSAIIHTGKP